MNPTTSVFPVATNLMGAALANEGQTISEIHISLRSVRLDVMLKAPRVQMRHRVRRSGWADTLSDTLTGDRKRKRADDSESRVAESHADHQPDVGGREPAILLICGLGVR